MLKHTILAGLLGLAALSTTASAQDNTAQCDDAGMKQLQSSIDMEQNQTNKDMAMKAMMMAQDSMKAGNLDQCAVHMGEARQAMTMK